MKLSCEQWCHIQEILANLKCPNCFSVEVKLNKEEPDTNAECQNCECKFEFNPDIAERWE